MNYLTPRAVILAAGFILISLHTAQAAPPTDIQMLPPTTNAATPSPCDFGTNQVLTLNDPSAMANHSAINCNSNFVATPTGQVGIGTATPNSSLDLSNKTDAVSLPSGTTAQEPASPTPGMTRYNKDTGHLEYYDGLTSSWQTVAQSIPQVTTVSATFGFTVTANFLDCPLGWINVGCSSVVVPSGAYSCQVTPGGTDPSNGLSACAQAGCSAQQPADYGYYTAANCLKF